MAKIHHWPMRYGDIGADIGSTPTPLSPTTKHPVVSGAGHDGVAWTGEYGISGQVPGIGFGDHAFSVGFWAKRSYDGGCQRLLGAYGGEGAYSWWFRQDSSGNMIVEHSTNGSTRSNVRPSYSIPIGDDLQWVVMTRDGTDYSFYLDGVFSNTDSGYANIFEQDTFFIALNSCQPKSYVLDDVEIWDECLTGAEIAAMYVSKTAISTTVTGDSEGLELGDLMEMRIQGPNPFSSLVVSWRDSVVYEHGVGFSAPFDGPNSAVSEVTPGIVDLVFDGQTMESFKYIFDVDAQDASGNIGLQSAIFNTAARVAIIDSGFEAYEDDNLTLSYWHVNGQRGADMGGKTNPSFWPSHPEGSSVAIFIGDEGDASLSQEIGTATSDLDSFNGSLARGSSALASIVPGSVVISTDLDGIVMTDNGKGGLIAPNVYGMINYFDFNFHIQETGIEFSDGAVVSIGYATSSNFGSYRIVGEKIISDIENFSYLEWSEKSVDCHDAHVLEVGVLDIGGQKHVFGTNVLVDETVHRLYDTPSGLSGSNFWPYIEFRQQTTWPVFDDETSASETFMFHPLRQFIENASPLLFDDDSMQSETFVKWNEILVTEPVFDTYSAPDHVGIVNDADIGDKRISSANIEDRDDDNVYYDGTFRVGSTDVNSCDDSTYTYYYSVESMARIFGEMEASTRMATGSESSNFILVAPMAKDSDGEIIYYVGMHNPQIAKRNYLSPGGMTSSYDSFTGIPATASAPGLNAFFKTYVEVDSATGLVCVRFQAYHKHSTLGYVLYGDILLKGNDIYILQGWSMYPQRPPVLGVLATGDKESVVSGLFSHTRNDKNMYSVNRKNSSCEIDEYDVRNTAWWLYA